MNKFRVLACISQSFKNDLIQAYDVRFSSPIHHEDRRPSNEYSQVTQKFLEYRTHCQLSLYQLQPRRSVRDAADQFGKLLLRIQPKVLHIVAKIVPKMRKHFIFGQK